MEERRRECASRLKESGAREEEEESVVPDPGLNPAVEIRFESAGGRGRFGVARREIRY